jgi:hypothetical protein
MQKTALIAKLALLAAGFSALADASVVFTFDNDSVTTATTFTDTVGNVSATFSSASAPGAYSVQQSFFDTLTGNVLASGVSAPLTISFNSNLSAIDLLFATADFNTPSPFTLTAYEGNTLAGTNTSVGMFIGSFLFPEGEIAFDGATFNSVVLSSAAPSFAIDNVAVAPAAATPEPSYGFVFGLALIALSRIKHSR